MPIIVAFMTLLIFTEIILLIFRKISKSTKFTALEKAPYSSYLWLVLYVGDKHTMDPLEGTSTSVFDFTDADEVSFMQNFPRGFVGWFKESKLKLYVANVSEELVESLYEKSMRNIFVECLQLVPPKGTERTLNSIFFSTSRGFREFLNTNIFLCYQQTQG